MKAKRLAQYVCAAILAFGFGLNIQNALTGYGISDGSTSITAGDDTNSGSNGSTNGSTNGSSNGCSNGCSNCCSNCCSNGCSNCCSNGHCSNGSTSTRYYRGYIKCDLNFVDVDTTYTNVTPPPGDYTEQWRLQEDDGTMYIWARDISTIGKKGECMTLDNGYYTSIQECQKDFDMSCKKN